MSAKWRQIFIFFIFCGLYKRLHKVAGSCLTYSEWHDYVGSMDLKGAFSDKQKVI